MLADPSAAAALIVPELERRGVACAVGGALCLAWWGVPRATKDLDVNLFVADDALEPAFDALEAVGARVDRQAARARARARGDVVAELDGMRIDLFVSFHRYHDEVARRVTRGRLPGGPEVGFLAAEDLCVFKVLFYRAKDLVDLDRLFAARGREFDIDYVLRWLADLLGEDPRIADTRARFDRIVSPVG